MTAARGRREARQPTNFPIQHKQSRSNRTHSSTRNPSRQALVVSHQKAYESVTEPCVPPVRDRPLAQSACRRFRHRDPWFAAWTDMLDSHCVTALHARAIA